MKIKLHMYLFIILVLFFSNALFGQSYNLVWSEEFNGRQLDENIWTRVIGGNGWGNDELQFYTERDTNAFIEKGNLVIQALEENFGSRDYTSARLSSQDKKSFKYGKIEARIKLPFGQGLWPAFWMLGNNFSSVGWPACGEIDIMEMIGGTNNDNRVYGTIHWENEGQHAEYGGNYHLSSGVFANDFHVFSVEWTAQSIKWFVDGIQYHVVNITPTELSEFHQRFFIVLNIAVGGTWPGSPNAATIFPQRMEVDYVRVYQNVSSLPKVGLTEPSNNISYGEFEDIKITANVEFNGMIEKVQFYQDELIIGETDLEPYEMNWRKVSAGSYNIKAVAQTVDGYLGESETINVVVGGGANKFPYAGSPVKIPGIIEAEDFDAGGTDIAYSDNTTQNVGAAYRTGEGVDIEICSDENGGYNVGWTEEGEWIKYLVDVKKSAEYEVITRVASINSGGSFLIEIDGVVLTESIMVPSTGGWQEWVPVTTSIELDEGIHEFKFVVEGGEFNVNKFEIYEPNTNPQITIIQPTGGETLEIGSIIEIQWDQLKINEINIGLSIDGGNNWSFVAKNIKSKYGFYRWRIPDSKSENCVLMIIDSEVSSIRDITDSVFTIDYVSSVELLDGLSDGYSLEQNYPNPFNPETVIGFRIPQSSNIVIKLYDQLGREIKILLDEFKSAGDYQCKFDGSDLSSGVYHYRIQADNFTDTKKLILIK